MIKPILFNTQMVQAILEGRKTTTRRIIKTGSDFNLIGICSKDGSKFDYASFGYGNIEDVSHVEIKDRVKAPYMPGDILYVRETWCDRWLPDGFLEGKERYGYKADGEPSYGLWGNDSQCKLEVWIPSIHMPKEAARIFLKVTSVKVEKLQNMKYGDYQNEGAQAIRFSTEEELQKDFIRIWNSTVKKTRLHSEGWDGNPWVWVIEFERIEKSEAEQ